MSKNLVELEKPQMTSQYWFSTATVIRERASVLRYSTLSVFFNVFNFPAETLYNCKIIYYESENELISLSVMQFR